MSAVDHPEYYNSLGAACPGCGRFIECIDVVEEMTFNVGSAVKYLWRAGFKAGEAADQDLAKAAWYIARERDRLKRRASPASKLGVSARPGS